MTRCAGTVCQDGASIPERNHWTLRHAFLINRPSVKKFLALFSVLIVFAACGGRVPSPQTAHGKIYRHFEKYGNKHKESDFGRHKIDRVEIVAVREIQKKIAEVDAYAHLSGGPTYKVRVTLRKKTFGWKVMSWENLGPA